MGIPAVTGDIGGPYVPPSPTQPPLPATMISGSTTVLVKNLSCMTLLGPPQTSLGPIISSTLNTMTTLVQNSPVVLGGSVTNLGSGYSNGVIIAIGAIGVLMN